MQDKNNNKSIKIKSPAKSNLVLIVFFMLSFLVYLFPFSNITLGIPISFLLVFALKEVLKYKNKDKLFYSIQCTFSKKLIGLNFIFPALSLIGFLLSEDKKLDNVVNFFMIYVIGISSNIILVNSKKTLETLISSFYISGVFCIILYSIFNFNVMLFSLMSNIRFTNYSFHFNLIGYIVAGFSGTILFQIITKKHVIFNVILFLMSILIIVAAQSRGSLFAIIISMIFSFLLYLAKRSMKPNVKKKFKPLVFLLIMFLAFVMLYLFNFDVQLLVNDKYQFLFDSINAKLELSTDDRGLGTGLTGRTDVWNELIKLLDIRILAFGNGYRTLNNIFESVDNGYLVVIYENGLFCLLILLSLILSVMFSLTKVYFSSSDKNNSALYLSFLYLIVTFLANNFVARYLLSVGNPFSAFMIVFLFASPIFLNQIKKSEILQ